MAIDASKTQSFKREVLQRLGNVETKAEHCREGLLQVYNGCNGNGSKEKKTTVRLLVIKSWAHRLFRW